MACACFKVPKLVFIHEHYAKTRKTSGFIGWVCQDADYQTDGRFHDDLNDHMNVITNNNSRIFKVPGLYLGHEASNFKNKEKAIEWVVDVLKKHYEGEDI